VVRELGRQIDLCDVVPEAAHMAVDRSEPERWSDG
jgi:hypothetical protein